MTRIISSSCSRNAKENRFRIQEMQNEWRCRLPRVCSRVEIQVEHKSSKGQLISKGLFGILNSSKKWTKKFNLTTMIKFRFSKKATKFETISHMIWRLLSKYQITWEIVSNFCGLFRMSKLYLRSTCFRSFFGRIWRHQRDISKLTGP